MNTGTAPSPSLRYGLLSTASFSGILVDALVESALPPLIVVTQSPWTPRSYQTRPRLEQAKRAARMVVRPEQVKRHHSAHFAAKRHRIRTMDSARVASPSAIATLRALELDYLFVYGFELLPESVYGIPKHGTVNAHSTLLPDGRGPEPTFWTIANRHETAAITFHMIDAGVDTGPIIEQHVMPRNDHEDRMAARIRGFEVGVELYVSLIHRLARGMTPTLRANDGPGRWVARYPTGDDLRIDPDRTADDIVALVHASRGIGTCWFVRDDVRVGVERAIRLGAASEGDDHVVVDRAGNVTMRTGDDELLYLVTSKP